MNVLQRHVWGMGMASVLAASLPVIAQDWTTGVTGDYTIVNDANGSKVPFTIEANTATNSMFLDSTGNVGLGTSTPGGIFSARIHIADLTPDILLDDTDNPQLWYLFADYEGMGFADETGSSIPFFVESAAPFDALRVAATGNVGIGTETPTSKLHAVGTAQTQIRAENTDSLVAGDQIMFSLINASDAKVRFAITSDGSNTWTFDNTPALDSFTISKVGTGVNEFQLASNGDGRFRGRSFATLHVDTSTREAKTDFVEIDASEILNRTAELPISQWRYRTEAEGEKHIGPVAEDFQRIFGIGDGRTIATVDASGVALASVQALYAQLLKKEEALREQSERLEEQARVLKEQDKRLRALEKQLIELARQGDIDQLAQLN